MKRSGHVALLLMGTLAVGGGAYALMPRDNCERPPNDPRRRCCKATPNARRADPRPAAAMAVAADRREQFLQQRFLVEPFVVRHVIRCLGSGGVTRGGFGSFAHAFASHFSGGG